MKPKNCVVSLTVTFKTVPCPFCASHDLHMGTVTLRDLNDEERHYIYCAQCGACGPRAETYNQAAETWDAGQYFN